MSNNSPSAPERVGLASFPDPLAENPYQRLLYEAMSPHGFDLREGGEFKLGWLVRNRRAVRVLHFHWPQDHYRHPPVPKGVVSWAKLMLFGVRLAAARALGYRIAWTIHEVYPLKTASRALDRRGGRLLARFCNVLLANDKETAELARAELGRAANEVEVVPHSSYVGAYPEGRPGADVRADLGIPENAFVFLLFGHVSAYKQVEWFVEAFRQAELPDAALVVAGLVMHEESGRAVRAAARDDSRIKPLLEFIADDRVSELFAASDAAICPRQDGGTSGALILAMSMGLPGIVARVSSYEEITAGETAAWLYEPHDQRSVSAALEAASANKGAAEEKGRAARRLVEPLSWSNMSRRSAGLLLATLESRGGGTALSAPERA